MFNGISSAYHIILILSGEREVKGNWRESEKRERKERERES